MSVSTYREGGENGVLHHYPSGSGNRVAGVEIPAGTYTLQRLADFINEHSTNAHATVLGAQIHVGPPRDACAEASPFPSTVPFVLWWNAGYRLVQTPGVGMLPVLERKYEDALGAASWQRVTDLDEENLHLRTALAEVGRAATTAAEDRAELLKWEGKADARIERIAELEVELATMEVSHLHGMTEDELFVRMLEVAAVRGMKATMVAIDRGDSQTAPRFKTWVQKLDKNSTWTERNGGPRIALWPLLAKAGVPRG